MIRLRWRPLSTHLTEGYHCLFVNHKINTYNYKIDQHNVWKNVSRPIFGYSTHKSDDNQPVETRVKTIYKTGNMTKTTTPIMLGNILRIEQVLTNYEKYLNKQIEVAGWVKSCRKSGNGEFMFIELSDGSTISNLQLVVFNTISNWQEVTKLKTAACIRVKATAIKSEGKNQRIELKIDGKEGSQVRILGKNEDDKYPLAAKFHKQETLRQFAHLRPRTNLISTISRIKNNLAFATHNFFQQNGFLYVHTPIITTSDCEGAGEMFQVTTMLPQSGRVADLPQKDNQLDYGKDFFKKPAGLTVSGQLAVENYCCALSKVYTFGPTFRAELSNTVRHLAEFWMIEPEMAFSELPDVMDCAQSYLKYCIEYLLVNNQSDLQWLANYQKTVGDNDQSGSDKKTQKQQKKDTKSPNLIDYLKGLIGKPFERLSYTKAIDILKEYSLQKKVNFEKAVEWGIDLGSEHQRYLCEKIFGSVVILHNYPKDVKPFYMRQDDDGRTVQSFDILVPGVGEIVGGSQREQRLDRLQHRIKQMNLNPSMYWWYLDLRRFGTVPHGGFGVGFERLAMLCTGVSNIREVSAFPRSPGYAQF